MLEIKLPEQEFFDRGTSKIRRMPEVTLRLEHSLLTISKWETIWEVPFLSEEKKTNEQLYSYVNVMSGGDLSEETLSRLNADHYKKLNDYLNAKHSATWFSEPPGQRRSTQTITSELIYYWMTAYNIPFECETWPLARLMNLIRIASIKNDPDAGKPKKNKSQMLSERAMLNKKRREQYGTSG